MKRGREKWIAQRLNSSWRMKISELNVCRNVVFSVRNKLWRSQVSHLEVKQTAQRGHLKSYLFHDPNSIESLLSSGKIKWYCKNTKSESRTIRLWKLKEAQWWLDWRSTVQTESFLPWCHYLSGGLAGLWEPHSCLAPCISLA